MDFLRLLLVSAFFTISAILPLYVAAYAHLLFSSRRYRPPAADRPEDWPKVSVHLPLYNEKHVAERLIEAVCRLDYPRDRLELVVVDDSTDETSAICGRVVRDKQSKGFNIRYLRRTDRVGYKAGALQHALESSSGEYVAVFDADFIPQPDFLKKMLCYFTEKGVGVVQARWMYLNREYSPLTRAQALSLDLHFTVEQSGRCAAGYYLNFNGTAGVWRRECIVDAGGWKPSLAEDLDLSYRAQLKGWRIVYVDIVEVPSELPVLMSAVKRQQYRWAYGAIQTVRRYVSQLTSIQKPFTLRFHGLIHLTRHVAQLLFMLQILLLPWVVHAVQEPGLVVMAFWLMLHPLIISTTLLIHASLNERYNTAADFLKSVFMLFIWGIGTTVNNSLAVLHALFSDDHVFERTPKFGIVGNKANWRLSSYAKVNDSYIVFEIAAVLYSLFSTIYFFYTGNYSFMLVTGIFAIATLYVVLVSVSQRRGDVLRTGRIEVGKLAAVAMLLSFSALSIIYPFSTNFYAVEKAYSSLTIASRSVEPGIIAAEISRAIEFLQFEGNPVWAFPTPRTEMQLIRRDLEEHNLRIQALNTQNYELTHSTLEDVRMALEEVRNQLRMLQPYVWINPSTLIASIIALLLAFYILVKDSHA